MPNELIIRNKTQRLLMFKALITERRDGFIVDGEALQDALENNLQYSKWIKRKIEQNNLKEGEDYLVYNSSTQKVEENQILDKTVLQVPYGGGNKLAYSLTVKATQRIAGKDRSEVGYELLDYLFDLSEKQLTRTPTNFLEALKALVISEEEKLKLKEVNQKQEVLIEEQKPKADFFDTVASTKKLYSIREAAKTLGFKNMGQNKLFEFLRVQKVLLSAYEPYQNQVDLGRFKIKMGQVTKGGKTRMTKKLMVTVKGMEYIRKLLINNGHKRISNFTINGGK